MARNVLVISTVEHADDVLRTYVGDAETIKVVVPVVRQGRRMSISPFATLLRRFRRTKIVVSPGIWLSD